MIPKDLLTSNNLTMIPDRCTPYAGDPYKLLAYFAWPYDISDPQCGPFASWATTDYNGASYYGS